MSSMASHGDERINVTWIHRFEDHTAAMKAKMAANAAALEGMGKKMRRASGDAKKMKFEFGQTAKATDELAERMRRLSKAEAILKPKQLEELRKLRTMFQGLAKDSDGVWRRQKDLNVELKKGTGEYDRATAALRRISGATKRYTDDMARASKEIREHGSITAKTFQEMDRHRERAGVGMQKFANDAKKAGFAIKN